MTGFNSSNTFIRVFSKYTGMTPQKYAEHVIDKAKNESGFSRTHFPVHKRAYLKT